MALADNELLSSTTQGPTLRFFPKSSQVGKVGAIAGAPTLAKGTPMSFDRVNSVWRPWRKAVSLVQTITIDATGGTFTISHGGNTTAALAWNASAATVQAAIEGLPSIGVGNVTVALATLVYTITLKGRLSGIAVPLVTTGAGSLTGGAGTAAVAQVTAAVDDDSNRIRGFLYPEALVTSATEEKQAVIMRTGRLHAEDVPTPSGESGSELDLALKGAFPYPSLLAQGFNVEGLASIV